MAENAKRESAAGTPRGARELIRSLEAQEGRERVARQSTGRRHTAHDRATLARVTVEAQRALREAVAAATDAALRARSAAAVMDEAMASLSKAKMAGGVAPPAVAAPPATVALSPREREVLALVAEGRSNKAIAEVLYISPNTVKTHIASLLDKHDARSRAQLAAMAVRHGSP